MSDTIEGAVETPVAPPAISIEDDLKQDGHDIVKTIEDVVEEVREKL